ncbi:MAG TPA: PAS domain S-box protein, partial [Terriglobales bacterium]|nr:PAS domain S-box protein [Terriglobales bacterium]
MSAKPIPEPPAERRAVSQQRRSADQQLLYQANLVENVNDAILAAELDLRLTHWNRAAEQIYGWKAGEVLGRYGPDVLGTVIPGRSRAEVYEELWRCGHWSGEAVQRRKDGSRVHIEARMLALYDADGSIVGLVTVNRDITERKRAEEALAESERKFRAVAEMAPAAVCVFDGRKFVYANASAERILGYPRAELLSMDPRRLVHPDFLPEVEARAFARLRGEPVPSKYELRLVRQDGSVRWVEMSAGLIKWDG